MNKPEVIDEGFWKGLGTTALMTAALAGGAHKIKHGTFLPTSSGYSAFVDDDDDDDDDVRTSIRRQEKDYQDLLAAAKRANVPKSEWKKLNGHKTGGVVVIVNGRKVPLTQAEKKMIKAAEKMGFHNF